MQLRPPTEADFDGAFAAILGRDIADFGVPDYTLDDLREQWADDEFDRAHDARVAVDETGRITGYAHVDHHGASVSIPPEYEGLGIGAQMLAWTEARERELGRPFHGQPVASTNTRAATFLAAHGYRLIRSYYRMVRPLGPEDRRSAALPGGITVRAIDRDADAVALHTVDNEAFKTASDYKPESVPAFRQRHLDLHDFDTEASLVACRDGGRVVGFLLGRRWASEDAGFVNVLGVHPDEHGRGIGTALLRAAFAIWAEAGLGEARLGVSSQNPGALRLYERLGMTARFQVDVWQRDAATP